MLMFLSGDRARETIMLLSPKKIADVRARLTTPDFDPVRLANGGVIQQQEHQRIVDRSHLLDKRRQIEVDGRPIFCVETECVSKEDR